MERYAARVDSYFQREELISMAISLFLAAFIWVTITDDLVMKSESQKANIQDETQI